MLVKELAEQSNVAPHIIRYYSRLGLLQPQRHAENDYQIFTTSDVKRVLFIRKAKTLGFSLKEITQFLNDAEEGQTPCPAVRQLISQRIHETQQKITELQQLLNTMEQAIVHWEDLPDGVPNETSVCPLIESFDFCPTEKE